jgi:hypothetical protein
MGREQRSRKRLPDSQICYLCNEPIEPDQRWNRDHVPFARLFAKRIREQLNPDLEWLHAHEECNSAYKEDEEYFVTAFVGHINTESANAVMEDLGRGARAGHGRGLIKSIINSFGQVVGPNGEMLFQYDANRVRRAVWKLVRGLYTLGTKQVLPEKPLGKISLVNPANVPADLAQLPWFPAVRDTEPLGRYEDVFDYKWLGWKDGEIRGHAFALMLWNGLIVAVLFHDPACGCGTCRPIESQ